jgi:hypothetical protein
LRASGWVLLSANECSFMYLGVLLSASRKALLLGGGFEYYRP